MLYTLVIKAIGLSLIVHIVALEKSQALTSDESGVRRSQSQTNHERRRRNAEYVITSEAIQNMVNLINTYRRNVVPGPASDMQYMEWDDELADLAQQWADECEVSLGIVDNDYPDPIEQNIYSTSLPDINLLGNLTTASIEHWNSYGNDYDYNSNECDGQYCDFYQKQVLASANSVGCGIKACPFTSFHIGLVLCYYAPGPFDSNQQPYQLGEPCSECTENTICDDGLCRSNSSSSCNLDCENGGECYLDEEDGGLEKCDCPDGFAGEVCQKVSVTVYCDCAPPAR